MVGMKKKSEAGREREERNDKMREEKGENEKDSRRQ